MTALLWLSPQPFVSRVCCVKTVNNKTTHSGRQCKRCENVYWLLTGSVYTINRCTTKTEYGVFLSTDCKLIFLHTLTPWLSHAWHTFKPMKSSTLLHTPELKHTFTHTYFHMCMNLPSHTHTFTCAWTYLHTHILSHEHELNSHTHTSTCAWTSTHLHTPILSHTPEVQNTFNTPSHTWTWTHFHTLMWTKAGSHTYFTHRI